MDAHGYGKILEVDLSSGKITKTEVDPEFGRKYIGGRGFGNKFLFDEVGPDVDPYSPENIVVFANGPLTGTQAPCGSRTEVTTKHPLTGSTGTGNTGGVWGARLKHAGFDVIIVRNKAERPVYLWIDNDKVEIRDAAHLWGKDARVTTDILQQELSPGAAVMAIGQGGENLVRYALTLNDYYHVAGRGGAGGVMGSKKLKAIAVRGTGTPKAARPEEFREAVKEARARVKAGDEASWKPGPTSMNIFMDRGSSPALGRSEQLKYSIGKGAICYACNMNCYNDMGLVKEGKYAGLKESNITRTMVIGNFAGLGIDNLPAVWKCKDLSQRFGMDYASSTRVISFAMDLFKQGIITKSDTDGIELVRGNEDGIMEILRKIAQREGFGNVLAEGSERAAKIIGRGAEQYVRTVKGMEGRGSGASAVKTAFGGNWWFLGGLTNPRSDATTSTHWSAAQYNPNWPIDQYDMFEDVKQKIYGTSPEQVAYTWEGKALMLKWFEELHSLATGLGFCFFPIVMRLAMGPNHFSRLYSTYTGIETSPEEMMESGERLFNLYKACAVREGQTRKDDFSPNKSDQEADTARINQFLDEYYELRGWDKTLGIPTREKLNELGLEDVANELSRLGKLPQRQGVV